MSAYFYQKSYAKYLRFALAMCTILCWTNLSKASHIVGGDIVYRCLGGNEYEIILNVYRDCQNAAPGAVFDNPARIGVFSQFSNNPIQVISIPFDPAINDTISNNLTDPCLIITDSVCVHTTTYREVVTLSPITGGYTFVYQRCCRNIIIQNIIDPSNSGTTFSVELTEEAMLECNNSPDFGNIAPIYICNQKPLIYDHSAIDSDGDSLVYRLCTPFLGGSAQIPQPSTPDGPPFDTVQWVEPFYGEDNMLGGTLQPLAIDSVTGILTAFPENIGTFVVGICVDEYRDDQLLSTVRRDFQYTIQECGEVISSFFSPEAQCEDLVIEFENESAFATDYEWYFDWPNTDLNSNDPSPTFTFPDTGMYQVALIAEPGSACADTFYQQVFLQNNSLIPDFAYQIFDCEDSSIVRVQDLTLDTISTPTQWLWEISYGGVNQSSAEQNPTFVIPNPIEATLILTVRNESGCIRFAEATFETGNNFPAIFLQDLFEICEGDSVSLNPNFEDIGELPYYWTPDNLLVDPMDPNPTVAPDMTTLYSAQIFGPDSLCYIIHQATVIVNQQPELAFNTEVDCNGLTVIFDNESVDANSYSWDFGDPNSGATSTNENPIYTYPDFGDYTVTLSTGPNAACPDTMSQTLSLVEQVLEADFTYDITDCDTDGVSVQFTNTSINAQNNTSNIVWEIGSFGTFNVENPVVFASSPGPVQVMLYIETAQGCTDTLFETVDVQLITLDVPDDVVLCPGTILELNPSGNPNYTYQWSPGAGLSGTDIPNPIANPSETTTYTVTVTQAGFEDCSISKDITVIVPPEMELNAGQDILTCDATVELSASSAVPASFEWTLIDGTVVGNGDQIEVPVSGSQAYILNATDDFGCTEQDPIQVEGGPVDISTTDEQIVCSEDPIVVLSENLDANDDLVFQWAPGSAIIAGGATPNPIISNVPGETLLTVTASNQFGCTHVDSVNLVIVDEDIDLAFDYILNCDGQTVEFINQSSNAFGYLWNFGDPNTLTDTSTAINPTYTYTDIDNFEVTLGLQYAGLSCVVDATDIISTQVPEVEAGFSFDYTECNEDNVVISFFDESINNFNNTSGWTWTFSNGMTSNLQNPSLTITADQTLTVTLVIETEADCQDTLTQVLDIELTEADLDDYMVLCPGETAELFPNANPNYSYQWTPTNGLSDPTAANPTVFVDETTTYTVEIRNFSADTCTLIRSVTVEVPPAIDLDVSPDQTLCVGPIPVQSQVDPPVNFMWTDNMGFTSTMATILVNPTETTTYYAIATDDFGCSVQDSVLVEVPEEIEIITEQDIISCGDPVTITADVIGGPFDQIIWTDGNSSANGIFSITVNPSVNTVYTVTVVDELGCETSEDIEVVVPTPIELDLDDEITACNEPTVITASTNVNVNFSWLDEMQTVISNANQITIDPDLSTIYYLTVTDDFGCEEQDSIVVTVPPELIITASNDITSCDNEPTQLSVTSNLDPAVSYEWFIGNTSISMDQLVTVNPSTTTTYNVVATDDFGCENSDLVTITVSPSIGLNLNATDTVFCEGPIVLEATTNTNPDEIIWTDINGSIINIGSTYQVNPDLTETYYVTVVDEFDCEATDTVQVTNGVLDLEINSPLVFCPADSVEISAFNTDPNDIVAWQWTAGTGGTILSDPTGETITIQTQPGEVVFYVAIENQYDCAVMDSVLVTMSGFDPLILDTLEICPGVPTALSPNANPDYVYNWTPGIGLSDSTIANPTAILYEDITYQVDITDLAGVDTCSASFLLTVKVFPEINLEASGDTTMCVNGEVTLQANSDTPVTYDWAETPDFANVFSNLPNPTVIPEGSSSYYVSATDLYGCIDTATIHVNSFPIDALLAPEYFLCVGTPIELEVTNNAEDQTLIYEWSPSTGIIEGANTNSPLVDPATPSTYEVIVSNQYNCTDTLSTFVELVDVDLGAFAFAEPDTIIFNSGATSQLLTIDNLNYQYNWTPAETLDDPTVFDPIASPDVTTEYTVTIEGEGGCTTDRTVTVVVIDPACIDPFIFVPTGFTPNDDGHNDILYVRGNNIDEFYFTVYNRWGQKLFETEDQTVGWDGFYQGERLTPDVYGFYLQAKCFNGQEYFKKGNVTLLR